MFDADQQEHGRLYYTFIVSTEKSGVFMYKENEDGQETSQAGC
jgi:hypothetical protein